MSYNQDNPFSRKSSPLNKDDKWIQKATASIKERGTEGVCTGDKFGGPTCPPGSKRYTLAKTFKAMAKKGGPSRESSEEEYMPSRKSSSPINHGDGSGLSPQDEEMMAARTAFSDQMPSEGDYTQEQYDIHDTELNAIRSKYDTGPSRKSSSPLNHPSKGPKGRLIPHSKMGAKNEEMHKNTFPKKHGIDPSTTSKNTSHFATSRYVIRNGQKVLRDPTDRLDDRSGGSSRRSSSPLNNTGITGLNYSKELQYMPIEDDMNRGMSRESSSPVNQNHDERSGLSEAAKKSEARRQSQLDLQQHHQIGINPEAAKLLNIKKGSGYYSPEAINMKIKSGGSRGRRAHEIISSTSDQADKLYDQVDIHPSDCTAYGTCGTSRESSSPIKHTKRDRRGLPVKHSYDSHQSKYASQSFEAEVAKHERTTWKKKDKDKAPSRKSSSPLNDMNHKGMSPKELHDHGMVEHPAKRPDFDKKRDVEKPNGKKKKKEPRVYGAAPKKGVSRESSSPLNHERGRKNHIHTAAGDKKMARIRRTQKEIIKKNSKKPPVPSRKSSSPLNDNGYDTPNPNWNQKKHDRQVKRVTRKLKKGKGVKLEKFGPEVIMGAMRNIDKKGN